ncbi:putative transcription regulator SWI/SNF-BAF60b family [Helianthus annuus]|nr:putative transcription regulator SWI/SNF-BAF60b family [Helianthus annuus]
MVSYFPVHLNPPGPVFPNLRVNNKITLCVPSRHRHTSNPHHFIPHSLIQVSSPPAVSPSPTQHNQTPKMASSARVFNGCRTLFAAAKSATPKPTTTAAANKKSTVKKTTEKKPKQPSADKPVKPAGILKPSPISPALAQFLGVSESARTDAVKKIWEYIKSNELQNPTNKKEIICDEKLKTIFDGKDRVGFLEIAKLLAPHFVKTA